MITETGFLTLKGSEEMGKTLIPGIENFLKSFDGQLDYDQIYTHKCVMSKTLNDLMSEKLQSTPHSTNIRYINGETIRNGSPISDGGFVKLGENN